MREILRELFRQQRVEIAEVHAMLDYIHLLLMIPQKCSVTHGRISGREISDVVFLII